MCFSSTYFYHWKFVVHFLIRLTERRDTYPNSFHISIFSARWVPSLLDPLLHLSLYYLWFFFWIGHHPLHPVWWRHFTPRMHVSRDLSFLLLYWTICFRSRCYRRFLFFKYDTDLTPCGFRRRIFRQHVVHCVFGQTGFRIWSVDRVDEYPRDDEG